MWPESDCPINNEVTIYLRKTVAGGSVPKYGHVPFPPGVLLGCRKFYWKLVGAGTVKSRE